MQLRVRPVLLRLGDVEELIFPPLSLCYLGTNVTQLFVTRYISTDLKPQQVTAQLNLVLLSRWGHP